MANITEVRSGYSTDTLNNIEKRLKQNKKIKIAKLTGDHCFSIIFDPRFSGLVARMTFVQKNNRGYGMGGSKIGFPPIFEGLLSILPSPRGFLGPSKGYFLTYFGIF